VLEKTAERPTKTGKLRYGVCVAGVWYNTFDADLAAKAVALKGADVTVTYSEGKYGKDLHDVVPGVQGAHDEAKANGYQPQPEATRDPNDLPI
jgi:hypothetical protein